MTLGAVINKRGFKAGFNAGDFAFVDVRFFCSCPGLSISSRTGAAHQQGRRATLPAELR